MCTCSTASYVFSLLHPYSDMRTLPPSHPQADTLYSRAVSHGLFPSQWQRPVMYERGLRAVSFWSTPELQAYKSDLSRVMSRLEEIKECVRSSFSVVCVVVCMNMLLYTVRHACPPPPHTHSITPLPSSRCPGKAYGYWRRMPLCFELRTLLSWPRETGAPSPSTTKDGRTLTTVTLLPRPALSWTHFAMHLSALMDRWVSLDCVSPTTQCEIQF